MKSLYLTYCACAFSLFMSGCSSSKNGEISRLIAAPLLSDCMSAATSNLYSNEQKEFSTASISLSKPIPNEVNYIGKSIKSLLSNETETIKDYKNVLKQNPIVNVAKVNLTSLSDKMSCEYVYFTDKTGEVTQAPVLFKVVGVRQTHYINSIDSVAAISPIEYLFDLTKSQNGFRLFNLNYEQQSNKSQMSNTQALKKIGDIIYSNNLLEFYDLDQPVSLGLAADLSSQSTSTIKIPSFVPQNPIYVTPPKHNNTASNLPLSDEENDNLESMNEYNSDRYIDPLTGINTTRGVLQKMRHELGIPDNRFAVGNSEKTGISINTNNFSRQEIQQGARQMQQNEQRKTVDNR